MSSVCSSAALRCKHTHGLEWFVICKHLHRSEWFLGVNCGYSEPFMAVEDVFISIFVHKCLHSSYLLPVGTGTD